MINQNIVPPLYLRPKEQSLTGGYDKKDNFDWTELVNYASKLLGCRDAIAKDIKPVEFSKETAAEALKNATSYIKLKPLKIDPDVFRKKCIALQNLFVSTGLIHDPQQLKLIKSFDWSALSDETIAKAGTEPTEFFVLADEELCSNTSDQLAPVLLAALLVQVVRALLSDLGEKMTAFIDEQKESIAPQRITKCPTCGEAPSLATITDGDKATRVKKLFCVCCGTAWPFERLCCTRCGSRNYDKLSYVYSEQDKAHRLHLCSECGGYMPTVFQDSLGVTFDYDVEQIAIGVVESVYLEEMLNKEGKSILND